MTAKQNKIMILAGGTGGHIYPALAVAQYLEKLDWQIIWVGTKRGLENKVVPQVNYPLHHVNIKGLRGKSVLQVLMLPMLLLHALYQAFQLIKNEKPDVVLGMGGFVSVPCGLICSLFNKPLVIHEQNAIAGTANRLLRHVADKVMYSFENTFTQKKGYTCSGNPVRQQVLESAPSIANEIQQDSSDSIAKQSPNKINILILGGSLGAKKLNEVVPEAISTIHNINIIHQCGEQHLSETKLAYAKNKQTAHIEAYFENMQDLYQWADLAICRAGAMTIAELAIAGVPAIFIPYPYAVDDHQRANAEYVVNVGGATMINDGVLNKDNLRAELSSLIEDAQTLHAMQKNIRTIAKPNATKVVAEACMEWVA